MHVGRPIRSATLRLIAASLLLAASAAPAQAADMFKCGKVYQDRPCESLEIQQRFSHAQGFAIQQVNPDTDRDCAKVAADAMAWWNRMAAGEPLEKLHAEIQEQKITRAEKSQLRDVLTAINGYRGTPREVRSQMETQCMAFKRRNGYPTERDADAAARRRQTTSSTVAAERELRQAEADARRAEADARRQEALERAAAARARVQRRAY